MKKIRTEHFDVPIVEASVVDPLAENLRRARQAVLRAELADAESDVRARAEASVEKAAAALDDCFWRVEFKGLADDAEWDALVNAHPAKDAQLAKWEADGAEPSEKPTMDLDAFYLALLVACIVDGDGMTEADWRAELWDPERWTRADRARLFGTVRLADNRDFSAGIPNG